MTKQEFLAMSLPYGVNAKRMHLGIYKYNSIAYYNEFEVESDNPARECCLPILHPLSDLTKEIEHKGEKFVPYIELLRASAFDVDNMTGEELDDYKLAYNSIDLVDADLISFSDGLKLVEWHFDIAKLIEKGEAIDVNTLRENSYK